MTVLRVRRARTADMVARVLAAPAHAALQEAAFLGETGVRPASAAAAANLEGQGQRPRSLQPEARFQGWMARAESLAAPAAAVAAAAANWRST